MVLVLINWLIGICFSITTRGFTDAPVFTHTREVRELPVSSFFESGKTAGSVKKLWDASAREAL